MPKTAMHLDPLPYTPCGELVRESRYNATASYRYVKGELLNGETMLDCAKRILGSGEVQYDVELDVFGVKYA